MAVLELVQGTEDFLVYQLEQILTALNADLASRIKPAAKAPQFAGVLIGDIPTSIDPVFSVSYSSTQRSRSDNEGQFRTIVFNIFCFVALAGDCTAMNYEKTLTIASDHVDTLMLTDSKMLSPKIHAGLIDPLQGMLGEAGTTVKYWPQKLEDKITEVHGWSMPYSVTFSLKTTF